MCKKEEHDETLGGEDWIECSGCAQWAHIDCYGLNPRPLDDEAFYCPPCVMTMANKFGNIASGSSTSTTTAFSPAITVSTPTTSLLTPTTSLLTTTTTVPVTSQVHQSNILKYHNTSTNNPAASIDVTAVIDSLSRRPTPTTKLTNFNDEVNGEQELKIINELILHQEKLVSLQERRLELMDRVSQKKVETRVDNWMKGGAAAKEYELLNDSLGLNLKRFRSSSGNRGTGAIPKVKANTMSTDTSVPDNNMIALLQTQMQLMCRSYLEELPVFDGDLEFWPIFYAQYKSTTQEGGFTNAHNLCRLRKCLKGEALDAVKGLLALPNSLDDVIEILEQRFGCMQVIVRRKLKKLEELPSPNENIPATVRHFHEFLRGLYATLLNAGANNYLQSPQTLDAAVFKLPPNMTRSWMSHRKQLGGNATIFEFIIWFERYYDCAVLSERDQSVSVDVPLKKGSRVNVHNTAQNSIKKQSTSTLEQCVCCKKSDHKLDKCEKFAKLPLRVKWSVVRRARRCFVCLLSKHHYKDCTASSTCNVKGCIESYHTIMHKHKTDEPQAKHDGNDVDLTKNISATVNIPNNLVQRIHFRVIPVILYNPINNNNVTTWAFLDEGSSPTMMSASIAAQLGVSGVQEELCTSWTDSSVKKEPKSQRVVVDISGVDQTKKFRLQNVRTVEELNLPTPDFTMPDLKSKYKHLADVYIPEIPFTRPEILIGLEHPKIGIAYETREGSWNEPVATRTRLGWTIHGREGHNEPQEYICHVCECNDDRPLEDMVRQFFTTESFGVKIMEKQLASKEDERALALLEKTTRKVGKVFETGLLWRNDRILLPDNKKMALRRLICFEQKLMKDPELRNVVVSKIESHFAKGYLRHITNDEQACLKNKRHWFLPIFTVSNLNKGGKVRLVFDAAAKCNGISLNDVLLKGPDQLASLFGILLRFREGKIAISADIAEMFHRVKIVKDDQYCQLILWRDLDLSKEPEVLVMSVMTFGSTCSPSSAQFVKNSNAAQYIEEMPRAVEAIVKRHYVDDWLDSFESTDEAIKVARQVRYIHAQGGFEIRNWISNSTEVLRSMNIEKGDESDVSLNVSDDMCEEKVLGLYWNTSSDEFFFKLSFNKVDPKIVSKELVPTKREVLRIVMSVYDPLGFLSIVTVYGKILLKEIWRAGISWDERISSDLVPSWNDWLEGLNQVQTIRIQRCYFKNNIGASEMHILCDASESAFAACAYLRSNANDQYYSLLIAAKTKVAPQKELSIPRLELQACLLAARLQNSIRAELSVDIESVIMWSDSKTALGWIRSTKRKFSAFVSHRVGEILDVTSVDQWRWVPSKLNVADDATRGSEIPIITTRWLHGPEFLLQDQSVWPQELERVTHTEEEVRQVFAHSTSRANYVAIQASRFSKYERLIRAVAYVYRYMVSLKTQRRSNGMIHAQVPIKELFKAVPALTGDELQKSEDILFKKIQFESYNCEVLAMQSKKEIPKSSNIYVLNPYLDEKGIVRLASRLDAAPVIEDFAVKRPILLNCNHEITALIVDYVHRKNHHRGRETVVNLLRQKMWIPKLRVIVNRVIKCCNFCKYLNAKPLIPKMAPLPPERLQPHLPAFSYTGIDFFGPIEVTVGRRHEKRWGMIFTCMTSRAIHLELASSLDTSSAIMCFRNFVNRRGMPITVFSDNGTNLRGAEKELRVAVEGLNFEQIKDETNCIFPAQSKMNWKFIPPGAPHFGGIWERMVRTVKSVLYIILKSKAPRDETLRSAIIEVENIVNSRPLTYSPNDVDSPESITPNLLLRGAVRDSIPLAGGFNCRKQWRISQAIADSFWKRWLQEYLPLIANRTRWYDDNASLTIGQVVLIIDENLKRGEWKKGVVSKLFPGIDGRIRSVEVKTAKSTYTRPVAKLAVIKDEIVSSSTSTQF